MVKRLVCAWLIICFCIPACNVFAETYTMINVNSDRLAANAGDTIPHKDVYNITDGEVSLYTSWRFAHTIQKGVFGKAEDDNSIRIYSDNLAESQPSYMHLSGILESSYEADNTLEVSFKIGYGVLHGPSVFVTAVDENNNKVYSGALVQVTDTGTVTFIGNSMGSIPDYRTNRWYDYRIIMDIGEEVTSASLYIDNVLYSEDVVMNGAVRNFSEFILAYHGSKNVFPVGSNLDTYIDDVRAKKYTNDDEVVINSLEISSTLDSVTSNGVNFIISDRSLTPNEFLESISGNFESIEYVRDNKSDSNPEIGDGMLRITTADENIVFADVKIKIPQIKPGLSYFDVTDFKLVRHGSKVGAKANIFNFRSWNGKTAVMVMVLKDDAGAVRRVYSSPVISAYSPDGQTVEFPVEIQPVENEGFKPYVFFLSDWDDYLSVKDRVYK